MAIHESKKQSDLEKRLRLLRRQVYGKNSEHSERLRTPVGQNIRASEYQNIRISDFSGTPSNTEFSDITYLHHDLLKILVLSSIAIGAQIILFFLTKNHILNINFF